MTDEQPEGLTRLTVNLVPKAAQALESAMRLAGDTKTDTVNRALAVYGFLCEQVHGDAGLYAAALVECWREKRSSEGRL